MLGSEVIEDAYASRPISNWLLTYSQPSAAMSSAPPPSNPPSNNEKQPETPASSGAANTDGPAAMDVTPDVPPEETWDDIPEDIISLSTDEIKTRTRLIDNDVKVCFCPLF